MFDVAISVIMPVYNAKDYVGRAIESVLSQDFDSFELILVDDGSTDGSADICDEYAKKDTRIVIIHQKNAGTCAARNAALDVAKGKYITFCDHDDEYLPHLLRDNYELIEKEGADVLQFSINRIYVAQQSKILEQRLNNEVFFFSDLWKNYPIVRLKDNFVDVWNHLYRRNVIGELRFRTQFNHGMEDQCFNLEILPRIKKSLVLSSGVYYNHYLYTNSSGAVTNVSLTDNVVEQYQIALNLEYANLVSFGAHCKDNEKLCGRILTMNLDSFLSRVALSNKRLLNDIKEIKFIKNYPLRLSFGDDAYLFLFRKNIFFLKAIKKYGFFCEDKTLSSSALYGFFLNLYQSKRGRWLFDLCNFGVKVITLPFRLFK